MVRWLLGEIPERIREPNSGALAVWVAYAAAIGMWFGLRLSPKGDPVLVGTWRMLVHGGIPLVAVALWELRDGWRSTTAPGGAKPSPTSIGLSVAGIALLLAPIAARFSKPGLAFLTSDPFDNMARPALIGTALVLGGLILARRDLSKWGIGLGDWRWWLPHHGVLLAALIPVLVATTYLVPPLAAYYPVNKAARLSLDGFAWAHLGIALDFLGWEFLFRGFLLFGMARRGDALLAILLHVFPFFLLHGNKPHIELLSSFVGGIFAGWFCLRARSFFPLFVIHVVMMTTVGFTSFLMRNGYL
ncbi:MAG: CPBP family intramembrane metalloprotease [Pseudomonadota bacterium]|nr:CPBP family intramembrane metalloprotease [Pseudomonadota bacterium]